MEIPWDLVGGGSAAASTIVVTLSFLKHLTTKDKIQKEERLEALNSLESMIETVVDKVELIGDNVERSSARLERTIQTLEEAKREGNEALYKFIERMDTAMRSPTK